VTRCHGHAHHDRLRPSNNPRRGPRLSRKSRSHVRFGRSKNTRLESANDNVDHFSRKNIWVRIRRLELHRLRWKTLVSRCERENAALLLSPFSRIMRAENRIEWVIKWLAFSATGLGGHTHRLLHVCLAVVDSV
jgi:hypothetical protein